MFILSSFSSVRKTPVLIALSFFIYSSLSYSAYDKKEYERRLETFKHWHKDYSKPPNITPETLAKAGLEYMEEGDKTRCSTAIYDIGHAAPACETHIEKWQEDDIPIEEHIKHHFHQENGVYCAVLKEYMSEESNRLSSLRSEKYATYDCQSIKEQFGEEATKLASNGFYLVPRTEEAPLIITYCCELQFTPENRKTHNSPIEHHKQKFPHCAHFAAEQPPKHPTMENAENRIRAFDHLPIHDSQKYQLAQAGFFPDEQQDYRCFRCDQRLPKNVKGKNAKAEHAKLSPNCPFVAETLSSIFIRAQEHERAMEPYAIMNILWTPSTIEDNSGTLTCKPPFNEEVYGNQPNNFEFRFSSLVSAIAPQNCIVPNTYHAQLLAQAGFSYKSNKVKCQYCPATITEEDAQTGVWTFHVRTQPTCPYVQRHLPEHVFNELNTSLKFQDEENETLRTLYVFDERDNSQSIGFLKSVFFPLLGID